MFFHLHIGPLLQCNFKLKEINLAFIFQVNCPGCFTYGFPVINALYNSYSDKVGILGLSTCFEDYDKNTLENTIKLLKTGEMVGETKKHFASFGITNYLHPILFPVAFDETPEPNLFSSKENLELVCRNHPDYINWQPSQQESLHSKVKEYYSQFPLVAKTFALNQLQGTPSFVLFDKDKIIRKSLFGYQSLEEMAQIIENEL